MRSVFSVPVTSNIIEVPVYINGHSAKAIVDTGATRSGITCKFARSILLKRQNISHVRGVNSVTLARNYFADVTLASVVNFRRIRLVEVSYIGDSDLLIGMDILMQGNFSLVHKDGKAFFSYELLK